MSDEGWADQWVGTVHITWHIGPPYMPNNPQCDYTLTADASVTFSKKGDTFPDGLEVYRFRDATINYLASGTITQPYIKCNMVTSQKRCKS
jgi:hypothetical protein